MVKWGLNNDLPNKNAFDNILQDLFRACRVGYDVASNIYALRSIAKAKLPSNLTFEKTNTLHRAIFKLRCRDFPLVKGQNDHEFDPQMQFFNSIKSQELRGWDKFLSQKRIKGLIAKRPPFRGIPQAKAERRVVTNRPKTKGPRKMSRKPRKVKRCFTCGGPHLARNCPKGNNRVRKTVLSAPKVLKE